MFCSAASTSAVFNKIPDTTNAVKSHNRCSKGSSLDILKVALMSTCKIDMAAALEHLAKRKGITTCYEDLSPASRATRTEVSNKARSRKRAASDDAEGLPDRHQDFKRVCLYSIHTMSWYYVTLVLFPLWWCRKKEQALSSGRQWLRTTEDNKHPYQTTKGTNTVCEQNCDKEKFNTSRKKEGGHLQDVHMAVAGTLIRKKFPARAGFQPTLYSSEQLEPHVEGTIQFHFDTQRQHWTMSTFSGGAIRYLDSLYPGYLSTEVQQQLKALYGHLMKTPTVSVVRVQQRQGTVDYGLFAIAYAVNLAHWKDPTKTKFSQKTMRAFFVNCIKNEQIELFSTEKTVAHVARVDTIILWTVISKTQSKIMRMQFTIPYIVILYFSR